MSFIETKLNSLSNSVTYAPVSVVIPCFRCATTIGRAIESVLQQTQKPVEVILVDDCSGDDTLNVLQSLAQLYPEWIRIIVMPENQGSANARNIAWAAATQPYIAFLDADDAWHTQKIEIQTAYMNDHPEVTLSGHGHKLIERSTALPDWCVNHWTEREIPGWSWLLSNKFITPSVMVRRDINQRFVQNQRYMEDHMLWIEIANSGNKVTKLSAELVAIYKKSFGVSGLSSNLWLMEKGELGNYQRLYNKNYINLAQWLALSGYSLLKFVRRLVIYCGWLRWKK